MIRKVLIANRGEIAVRIIRACKEMGIRTVAVYSTEDKDQLHVQLADEAFCIGGPRVEESYLNIPSIITVASETGVDAIHPGYGFLSENSDFAEIVEDIGIKFIGPSARSMSLMGDKQMAREVVSSFGVPIIPGSNGELSGVDEALELAEEVGYPVLLKASLGGGGKGMRAVFTPENMKNSFYSAQLEAKNSCGSDGIYMEKLIENPIHIEFQIIRDSMGNSIHLGERHCSIQRRNQKLIEEAPYKYMTEEKRAEMGQVAVKVAEASKYEGVGTVEFLIDEDGSYYFIEMNTRLQVEHGVTEMVTGVDIVKEQIRIASGLSLSYKQEDIKIQGHAIEVRVNAEDSTQGFLPSTGTIHFFFPPGGVDTRFDSHIRPNTKISPYYDSLIGKIMVKDRTRLGAIRRMRRAIEETFVEGIITNLPYSYSILFTKDFIRGDYDVSFIDENHEIIREWMDEVSMKGRGLDD